MLENEKIFLQLQQLPKTFRSKFGLILRNNIVRQDVTEELVLDVLECCTTIDKVVYPYFDIHRYLLSVKSTINEE